MGVQQPVLDGGAPPSTGGAEGQRLKAVYLAGCFAGGAVPDWVPSPPLDRGSHYYNNSFVQPANSYKALKTPVIPYD